MKPIRRSLATLLVAALSALAAGSEAGPGARDASFGVNGVVDIRMGESEDSAAALLRRADGKLLAVGRSGDDAAIARYLPDGTLDSSFGNGGLARVRFRDTGLRPIAAAEQADGKIVTLVAIADGAKVLRFDPDGTLDGTFDHAATTFPAYEFPGPASGIASLPDGRILVAVAGPNNHFGVARLSATGALDPTFGTAGMALADAGSATVPAGVAVQPDGRIVVAATVKTPSSDARRIAAVRFHADGSRDLSFSMPVTQGDVRTLALQPDGKVVLAGCLRFDNFSNGNLSQPFLAVWRTLPNGAPDAAFGGSGFSTFTANHCATGVAVTPSGRIGVSGLFAGGAPGPRSFIGVLHANGARDTAFGPDGLKIFLYNPATSNNENTATAVIALPDGNLLAAGDKGLRDFALELHTLDGSSPAFGTNGRVITEFMAGGSGTIIGFQQANGKLVILAHMFTTISYPDSPAPGPPYAIARFRGDGAVDTGFGNAGHVRLTDSVVNFLALPDERLLLASHVPDLPRSTLVTRLDASGSPDPSFGSSGRTSVSFAVTAMRSQPDGRIVLVGFQDAATNAPLHIARLMPDGSRDASFGTGGVVNKPYYATFGGPGPSELVIQPDGKILVGDSSSTPFSVIRLNPDGTDDTTFGNGGATAYPIARGPQGTYNHAAALLLHADERITIAGHEDVTPSICSFVDGTQVAFGRWGARGGSLQLPPHADLGVTGLGYLTGGLAPGLNPRIHGAVLDANDRIVAAATRHVACDMGAGLGSVYSRRRAMVFRFTPSGALDTRFGPGGMVDLENLADASRWQVFSTDVAVQQGGRIVAAVTTAASSMYRMTLYGLEGGGESEPIGPPQDIDADGIPNAVEQSEAHDPFVRDNDVFASARLFVMQQYRDFLDREGDASGIVSWTNFMTGGENRATVADSFLRSPEFEGTVAPVTRLYFAYFLRIPDYGGLRYWIMRFRGGASLDAISDLFAGSPEFAATYGALDNAGFVDRVYRNVLGRAPDPGGAAYWTGRLDAGLTRGQMMVAFSESPEYRALIANEVYVTMVYAGMLRRAPDPGGFAHWVSYLDAGNSGIALINAFLAAPEYRARFLP